MRRRPQRRGAIMLMVLVIGAVLTLVLLGILHLIANGAQQLRGQQGRVQATWLAEAALERATVRLKANPAYAGETWAVPPERLDGRRAARVEIVVEAISGQPRRRMVRVVADVPDHPQDRTRHSRQVVLELP